MKNIISLFSRILLAQLFLIAGYGKLGAGYAATSAYMAAYHTPALLLPLVIALELAGGIALVLGFQTRFVSALLAGFCLVAALIFHHDLADKVQSLMFMKDFAISGGLLLLTANGAGAYSVDAWRAADHRVLAGN
jgi:putative oxidoreductase